ncbi:outer membrane protein assembly factor BamE [Roseovarius sp. LXJ103]|uniref:outer membrane protein assembly factor BamE n=1 Tax=Roseovarius carneus TaxID=2853164 RepID=UPI000D613600|nr:outer membrane protein assembly factor BamE [Roseovarius carneus]MBZ8119265.1 outer membrane protein assembly factor BamE [Roseovarius carneus]PWE35112.1 outer membrane protein assembly factor BamE [Pelagicola sp. LXJ1103]
MFGHQLSFRAILAAGALCFMTACSATFNNHGYVPLDEDLQQLVVGVDSRATVDDLIGPPSASGVLSGGDYYYVRSRIRNYGIRRPEVIERQVLAISFDGSDTIANIERFDLSDGKIVALSRRATNSSVEGQGFLRQILGNIGNINPADFF